MNGYKNLLERLEKLKENIAIFQKVVLHAHSPDSYDYAQIIKRKEKMVFDTRDKNIIENIFLEEIKSINIDMLAITDHMKCDFSCRLSQLAKKSNKCILPGMEINFQPSPPLDTFKLHIIAIFPEDYTLEQICKILPKDIPDEKNRTGRELIKGSDLTVFIKTIHDFGGLCIAAHIDNESGVRKAFRQLGKDGIVLYSTEGESSKEEDRQISGKFKDWILTSGFDAIEVAKETDKEHYRWISEIAGKKVSIPVLLSTNAHNAQDIANENRVTHIKMTSICFEGLKQALQFPDTRIRFPGDVPIPPSPIILGLEIIASDEKGFFKTLRISFSDNLTCLIGPRGSGKSTIIEALRYAFGYNRTLHEIEQPSADLANKVKGLQEATLTNCVIRVVYCVKDRENHILEATYDQKQDYTTRVFTINGDEREVHDVETSGLYPMRLFGWSEIETLGREAHRQRDLIDRLIPGINVKLEQLSDFRSSLADKRRNIETLVSNLSNTILRNNGEIKRYKEYKADFDLLNTPVVQQLFLEIDTAKTKEKILSELKNKTQERIDSLLNTMKTELFEGLDELLIDPSETLKNWWSETKLELKIPDIEADVRKKTNQAVDLLKDLVHEVDINIQKLKEIIQKKETEIREKVSDETAKQVAAERRRIAEERLQRVQELKRDYKKIWEQFEDNIKNWMEIAKKLADLSDEISDKRARRKEEIESRLNQFGTQEMKISLRFKSGGDRINFENYLRDSGFLNRDLHGNYKANKWPEKISSNYTPIELAKAILLKKPHQINKSTSLMVKLLLDNDIEKRLIDTLFPFSHDDDADIPIVDSKKLDKILEMAEVVWNDEEGILLNNRPVENLSPGQRSSAMLPLIALSEDAPLVIDQPEDNLDNRLVGKMLVDILTDLKEKRQIIVATHNPNIVVSGDAEQVIVLDALSDSEGICTQSGSIDNKEIIKSILEIMEGGKDAFIARQHRYGLSNSSI
ncbi:MAG TPA: AAA family ATPase [archaeon]|nr:AAA family ATPase [archaeon]